MREILREVRVAVRQLVRSPGFTGSSLLVLALGIGGSAAIFSLVHALFLRPLPFAEPDRLLRAYGVQEETGSTELRFSVPKMEHVRRHQDAFAAVAAETGTSLILTGGGSPAPLQALRVSGNWFDVVGLRPALGRGFRAEEEHDARAAVLSHALWVERFGGDPGVRGRAVVLDGDPHTVVGVLPPLEPTDVDAAEVWVTRPYHRPDLSPELLQRGVSFLDLRGRLPEGRTLEEAERRLAATLAAYDRGHGGNADARWGVRLVTVRDDLVGHLRPRFVTLSAAVAFVLLIACSNVANLLLARFLGRRREVALRAALGATPRRIVRLFVCEAVTLSVASGTAAVLVALAALRVLPAIGAGSLPLASEAGAGVMLLVASLLLSLVVGVAMGLYPAWQAVRPDLAVALKDESRTFAGSRGQRRARAGLVAAQVALSLLLLVGAALLTGTFLRLREQPIGFDPSGVLIAAVGLPADRYPDAAQQGLFWERLVRRLEELPGVSEAALAAGLPLTENDARAPYAVDGPGVAPLQDRPLGLMRSVTPGYFAALGVPLLAGRDFGDRDRLDGAEVAILSRATAHRLFPGGQAVGGRLLLGSRGGGIPVTVVGIVGDVRSVEVERENDVEFYRPYSQRVMPFAQVVVRVEGDELAAVPRVEEALRALDPELPLVQPQSLAEVVRAAIDPQRLAMSLSAAFALMALVLAVVGVYSVVAHDLRQRAAEIGIRMMLGASRRGVVRLLVLSGLRPVLLGAALGVAGAFGAGRLLATQLFGVSGADPRTVGLALAVLLVAAAVACWLPARRSTTGDGWAALRQG